MSQSLSQLYVHLTFSTKDRLPFLKEKVEQRFHTYLAGILKKYESPAIIINSVPDHVHILFHLSKNYALAKLIEQIKKESSKWMKTIIGGNTIFFWQGGYAAFSISSSKLFIVKNYIENQKEHHASQTYRDEIEEFVKYYEIIEYDPKYFWE